MRRPRERQPRVLAGRDACATLEEKEAEAASVRVTPCFFGRLSEAKVPSVKVTPCSYGRLAEAKLPSVQVLTPCCFGQLRHRYDLG